MSGGVFVLLLLVVALGLLAARLAIPAWQQLRFIQAARPTTIGAVFPGELVLLEGRATGAALPSPVEGAPCVLWQVEVQEYRSTGRSGHWVPVAQHRSPSPLLVEEGSGTAAVELRGAVLELRTAFSASRSLLSPLPPHVVRALERFDVPTRSPWGFGRSLRVIERRVGLGQPLAICGSSDEREPSVLRAREGTPLFITDRPIEAVRRRLSARLALGTVLIVGLLVLTLLIVVAAP